MLLLLLASLSISACAEPLLEKDASRSAADKAVALLALASAREAQLDEADQGFLKKLHYCRETGSDCSNVIKAFQESKTSFRALEDQALAEAKQALTVSQAPHLQPLRSHVSKHSKAPTQSAQSSLHRLLFLGFGISLMLAAFLSGR